MLRVRPAPFALALTLAAAVAAPAAADPAATRAVVESQLEAMAVDDFVAAWDYAAPSIQQMFGSPEGFERMVRQGYPMVVAPSSVEFLGAETASGGVVVQRLRLIDGGGGAFVARYYLREFDGVWRIVGVDIERLPDVGA